MRWALDKERALKVAREACGTPATALTVAAAPAYSNDCFVGSDDCSTAEEDRGDIERDRGIRVRVLRFKGLT